MDVAIVRKRRGDRPQKLKRRQLSKEHELVQKTVDMVPKWSEPIHQPQRITEETLSALTSLPIVHLSKRKTVAPKEKLMKADGESKLSTLAYETAKVVPAPEKIEPKCTANFLQLVKNGDVEAVQSALTEAPALVHASDSVMLF